MPADYVAVRDSCIEKKRKKKGSVSHKDEQDCKRQAAIWYYKKHGKPVPRTEGSIMIEQMDEKTLHVMEQMLEEMIKKVREKNGMMPDAEDMMDKEEAHYADNINKLFPIKTKEQILTSAAILMEPQIAKVYDSVNQLYMFQRLLTAANTIFEKEEDHTRLRDILKGGTYQVDKIYTQEEMIAEATRLAEMKAKEMHDAAHADEAAKAEIEAAKKEAEVQKAAAEEAAKQLAAKEAELADMKKAQEAEAAQRAAEKAEADAKALAETRVKELVEAGVESSDALFTYVKSMTEEAYATFKAITLEAIEAAKKKYDDKNKDDKDKSTASIVDKSTPLPKNVSKETEDELEVAFASVLGKIGGDK